MSNHVSPEAEAMLREMGLAPTTIPVVLNNNAVPRGSQVTAYKDAETFLLKHFLVEEVHKPPVPGGWKYLRISEKGYQIVSEGNSIAGYFRRQSIRAEEKAERAFREAQRKYAPAKEEEQDVDEIPKWWLIGNGERFNKYYDPEHERPTWWAKYRLRRLNEMFPEEHHFPEKRWEKIADVFFFYVSPRGGLVLVLLLVAVILYVGFLY